MSFAFPSWRNFSCTDRLLPLLVEPRWWVTPPPVRNCVEMFGLQRKAARHTESAYQLRCKHKEFGDFFIELRERIHYAMKLDESTVVPRHPDHSLRKLPDFRVIKAGSDATRITSARAMLAVARPSGHGHGRSYADRHFVVCDDQCARIRQLRHTRADPRQSPELVDRMRNVDVLFGEETGVACPLGCHVASIARRRPKAVPMPS